ncbi:MAG TPA: ABC transporter substrate-binding protein [Acidimicrobiales bacterium]|nr:ABC transporter substrate-binding protein [Acidimicrobiales bacterium]
MGGGTHKNRRALPLLLAVGVVVAGCGARLTPAQIAALDNGNGAASNSAGADATATTVASSAVTGPAGAAGQSGVAAAAGGGATGRTSGADASGAGGGTSSVPGLAVANSVCRGPASGPGVSASEVDIGLVTTLSGPVPGLFAGALHGMQAFVAYLNSVGGVCGRKLVLKTADDNLDASQNASATQSLMNSVLGFVGSFSGVDQGSASVLQSNPGVPDVGEALSTERFNLANNFSPSPQGIAVDLAPWMTLKQKYPDAVGHMAVLSVNQATAQAETQAAMQGLQSIGYKFVYQDMNIELTQTDFSSDAQAMKAAGAQGLLFIATSSYYANVAKAMQAAGLKMALPVYNANAYDPSLIPDAGSAVNGTITYAQTAMYAGEDAGSNPMVALFDRWYQAVSGGARPDWYAVMGFMSGMLFVDGLNAGGGITRQNLMNGLKQVTSFDAGGLQSAANPVAKQGPGCYLIIDVVNQRFVRDPSDPASGLNCANAPNWYRAQ